MTSTLKAGLIQFTATPSIERNIALTEALIREAASAGAELIAMPEVSNLMQRRRSLANEVVSLEEHDSALLTWRDLAAELDVWLHVGSMVVRLPDDERFANRGILIDADGAIRARYDKIHMFDVDLEGGESYRESSGFRPGDRAVIVDTPWGGYGMTICYDLRFPHLYRMLAQAGARILTVPSAFTRQTGEAHWHTLLRARAIETGCFVLAPAQTGDHEDGRKTYGHALVVAPWGEVLADGGEAPGVLLADLDLNEVDRARGKVPSLSHDRPITPP
ncbi:MAG: carbon-nitrogen hydrolase family protein [Gammaproteobacteria bacterium]|nr:carbon-nitrogen hydrolase family protein [Gammaproteobacteria bacterium]